VLVVTMVLLSDRVLLFEGRLHLSDASHDVFVEHLLVVGHQAIASLGPHGT
jgi:hypothetical protein